jgi:hypothetical protein
MSYAHLNNFVLSMSERSFGATVSSDRLLVRFFYSLVKVCSNGVINCLVGALLDEVGYG